MCFYTDADNVILTNDTLTHDINFDMILCQKVSILEIELEDA